MFVEKDAEVLAIFEKPKVLDFMVEVWFVLAIARSRE